VRTTARLVPVWDFPLHTGNENVKLMRTESGCTVEVNRSPRARAVFYLHPARYAEGTDPAPSDHAHKIDRGF
jgi:hypothetical protein